MDIKYTAEAHITDITTVTDDRLSVKTDNELEPIKSDDEIELEATIKTLIDRRNAVREDSAEYNAIVRQLGELIDNHEMAGLIAEEYQALLGPLKYPIRPRTPISQ
jgi:hypothetical protein